MVTKRCAAWMFDQSKRLAFLRVAEFAGVHERTVRNVFGDMAAAAVKALHRPTPRVLGIDEKHVMGSLRGVFGDIEKRKIVEMLPTARADAINAFLSAMPDKDRVEVVCMDMSQNYLRAAARHLGHAAVVVDKFHVLRYATKAVDIVRKDLRSGLSAVERKNLIRERYTLLKRRRSWHSGDHDKFRRWRFFFPALAEAYEFKERVHEIFDQPWTPNGARKQYAEWEAALPDRLRPAFLEFTRAVRNWEEQVFNYFSYPFTNAYIERLNGCIDDINVMGRGYSFEVLRARTLLKHAAPSHGELGRSVTTLTAIFHRWLSGLLFNPLIRRTRLNSEHMRSG